MVRKLINVARQQRRSRGTRRWAINRVNADCLARLLRRVINHGGRMSRDTNYV